VESTGELPNPPDLSRLMLRQVWALDSDPGAQEPDHSHQVLRVVASLKKHPGPFASRASALTALEAEGLSSGLGNWLVTSLERSAGGAGEASFTWRFELPEIGQLLADYFSTDLWPFLERAARQAGDSPRFDLLVAENSDRWSGNMRERASRLNQSGGFRLHELADSGHWVHVDNPDGLLGILSAQLL
jgi:pimeloyl-ACP methyl ester carboxylesterase